MLINRLVRFRIICEIIGFQFEPDPVFVVTHDLEADFGATVYLAFQRFDGDVDRWFLEFPEEVLHGNVLPAVRRVEQTNFGPWHRNDEEGVAESERDLRKLFKLVVLEGGIQLEKNWNLLGKVHSLDLLAEDIVRVEELKLRLHRGVMQSLAAAVQFLERANAELKGFLLSLSHELRVDLEAIYLGDHL